MREKLGVVNKGPSRAGFWDDSPMSRRANRLHRGPVASSKDSRRRQRRTPARKVLTARHRMTRGYGRLEGTILEKGVTGLLVYRSRSTSWKSVICNNITTETDVSAGMLELWIGFTSGCLPCSSPPLSTRVGEIARARARANRAFCLQLQIGERPHIVTVLGPLITLTYFLLVGLTRPTQRGA